MILLDTNVISELMKSEPDHETLHWVNTQNANDLFTSTVSVAEIEFGLSILPAGKRLDRLRGQLDRFIREGFSSRVLTFDLASARAYGPLMASMRSRGRPMSVPDGQIAAIAVSNGFSLATRNTKDFEASGIRLIDPWASGSGPEPPT